MKQGPLPRSLLLLALALTEGGIGTSWGGTLSDYKLIALDGASLKWGEPVKGTPATVTYAVTKGIRHFPHAINCNELAPPDQLLATSSISQATFAEELKAAFAAWSAFANIDFVPAAEGEEAQILVGAQIAPRGRAFTNVDYDRSSKAAEAGGLPAPHQLRQSLICLNPEARWKVGFDGNLNVYDLRYTLEHEIGHAIGLDHPSVAGALMDFRYTERFRAPQVGDIRGAATLYGPRGGADSVIAHAAPAPPPPASSSVSALAISPPAD